MRLSRTSTSFMTLVDVDASINEIVPVLDAAGRESIRLLIDLRDGPMRSDPAFEAKMNVLRPKLLRGVARIAVLVSTPLGGLQLARHQRHDAIQWATFTEEADALMHLGIRPSQPG